MLEPHADFRELYRRRPSRGTTRISWTSKSGSIAWVDPPTAARSDPVTPPEGRRITESENERLLDWGIACRARSRENIGTSRPRGRSSSPPRPITSHPPALDDSDSPRQVDPSIPLPSPAFRLPRRVEQVERARASHDEIRSGAARDVAPKGRERRGAHRSRASGFKWAASDEACSRWRSRSGTGRFAVGRGASPPYRVETGAGPIAMVFRIARSRIRSIHLRELGSSHAADDLCGACAKRGARTGRRMPLVTVILDGENCWRATRRTVICFSRRSTRGSERQRHRAGDGVGSARARAARRRSSMFRSAPGSAPISGIWVGHAEKNRAWEGARAARRAASKERIELPPSGRWKRSTSRSERLVLVVRRRASSAHRAELDASFGRD